MPSSDTVATTPTTTPAMTYAVGQYGHTAGAFASGAVGSNASCSSWRGGAGNSQASTLRSPMCSPMVGIPTPSFESWGMRDGTSATVATGGAEDDDDYECKSHATATPAVSHSQLPYFTRRLSRSTSRQEAGCDDFGNCTVGAPSDFVTTMTDASSFVGLCPARTPCSPSLPPVQYKCSHDFGLSRKGGEKSDLLSFTRAARTAFSASPPRPPPIHIRCAAASQVGRRSHQEDCFTFHEDIRAASAVNATAPAFVASFSSSFSSAPPPTSTTFFAGVFDGHGGAQAAQYASEALHEHICVAPTFDSDVATALVDGLRHTDASMLASGIGMHCGTTVVAVAIRDNMLTVANLGDSRAVLSLQGVALCLTDDHRPSAPEETRRIVDCGGCVEHGRMGGEINVSRGLGDYQLKDIKCLGAPERQPMSNVADISTATLGEKTEFLLLASDGLWDVMGSQAAVDFIAAALRRQDPQPTAYGGYEGCCSTPPPQLSGSSTPRDPLQRACEALVHHAVMELNSNDNVTVVLITFDVLR